MKKQVSTHTETPKTAEWSVKGDGVAFTSSSAIIRSEAGRILLKQAAKVHLVKPKTGNATEQ